MGARSWSLQKIHSHPSAIAFLMRIRKIVDDASLDLCFAGGVAPRGLRPGRLSRV
jgi:hypothetical protein